MAWGYPGDIQPGIPLRDTKALPWLRRAPLDREALDPSPSRSGQSKKLRNRAPPFLQRNRAQQLLKLGVRRCSGFEPTLLVLSHASKLWEDGFGLSKTQTASQKPPKQNPRNGQFLQCSANYGSHVPKLRACVPFGYAVQSVLSLRRAVDSWFWSVLLVSFTFLLLRQVVNFLENFRLYGRILTVHDYILNFWCLVHSLFIDSLGSCFSY